MSEVQSMRSALLQLREREKGEKRDYLQLRNQQVPDVLCSALFFCTSTQLQRDAKRCVKKNTARTCSNLSSPQGFQMSCTKIFSKHLTYFTPACTELHLSVALF